MPHMKVSDYIMGCQPIIISLVIFKKVTWVDINHTDTSTNMEVFQINLLNFTSRMMLLYTLARGLSAALLWGLSRTSP